MRLLADVGDVDAHAVGDAVDVEQVAAVVGDQRVDEQHVGAELDELAREVAADEAEAAGDHHRAAAVELAVVDGHVRGELGYDAVGGVGRRGERPHAGRWCSRRTTSANQRRSTSTPVLTDAAEVEELRLAERAVVVMHRHFDDAEAGVLDLLHHLEADDAARLLEVDALEDRAPHQAEVAVDVAHLQPEQHADDVVVEAADDDAVQRIGAADLVAVHQIDVRRHLRPEHRQLRRVVLRVAVGVEDQLLGRRAEAGLQRAAVAAVHRMMDDAHVRIGARELVGDLRRRVGAAVVDDDDFVVRRQLRRGLDGADHHAGDGAAVVVGREEDTQTRGLVGGLQLTCEKPSKP